MAALFAHDPGIRRRDTLSCKSAAQSKRLAMPKLGEHIVIRRPEGRLGMPYDI
jgi:hypothetical protein